MRRNPDGRATIGYLMSTIRLSAIGIGSRLLVLALAFASSVIVARGIGPAGMGEYFLVISSAGLLSTLADFGLSSSAVVFAGRRELSLQQMGTLLLAVAAIVPPALGALAYLVYPSSSVWGHSAIATFSVVLIASMTLYNNYWTFMLVGRREITIANIYQCVTYAVFSAVLLALHATGAMTIQTVFACHLAIFGAQMLAQAGVLLLWARRGTERSTMSSGVALKEMTRFGLPLYPGMLASTLSLRIGVPMLVAFHGVFASGVFSVAYQIADKVQLIARAVQDAIYETVIRLKDRAAVEALNRYVRSAGLLFACLAAVGIVVSPLVVRVVYGADFASAALPLQLLLAGSAMYGVATLLSTYFVGQIGKPIYLTGFAVLSAVVAVLANRLLIPPMGATGAALALLITQACMFALSVFTYCRLAGVRLGSVLLVSADDLRELRRQLRAGG